MRPESGFRIALNWPKLEKWHWRHRQIFLTLFFSLVKLSYWSEFHVIIVNEVMTISFYKELTRNLKIVNTPVWVLPNIWTLRQVRNTKFGTNFSNKMLLNVAKCQGHWFYSFWVIMGWQTEGGRGKIASLPRLGFKERNK